MSGLEGRLIEDVAELEHYRASWDALAVTLQRPYCGPAWMLAWLRHVAPEAKLRAVVALEGDRLVGIAPFCAVRGPLGLARYRLLAGGSASPVEPLAERGREGDVAGVFADFLARSRPRVDLLSLEGVRATSGWPSLLATAWPGGRPHAYLELALPAPDLDLHGLTFEGWLASKSSNFRQQVRRARRQLDGQNASFRMSRSAQELDRDLVSFARLHRARWDRRGGSDVLTPAVERMVRDAAGELWAEDRFRLFCIDVGGRTMAAEVFLAAGGELAYWLGGFDDAWAAQRPSLLGIVQAIEDGLGRGDARCDLGAGDQAYKYRLADSEQRAEWVTMVPPGPRALLAHLTLAPRRAWRAAPEELRANVRPARRRGVGRARAGATVSPKQPKVVVTDVHIRSAVAGLRALGRAGLEPIALAPTRGAAGRLSRFASSSALGPDPVEDPAGFARSIGELAAEHGAFVVYPGREAAIDPLFAHAESLGPDVTLPYASREALEALRDKRSMRELAAGAGISTPQIIFEGTVAQLRDAGVDRPVVVKPVKSGGTNGTARVVESPAQLEGLLNALPPGEEVLVQERSGGQLMALGMVVGRDGAPVARIQQEAARTWPTDAGSSSLGVSVEPDEALVARSAAMLASAGYWGLAQLQFLSDDHDPQLIDVNPRFYGSLPLALAAGVNLPAAWHSVVLDRPQKPPGPYRIGVTYRWVEADLIAALRGSPARLRRAPRPRVGAWWAADDPLPAVALGVDAVWKRLHRRLPGDS